ncbi:hypothetical protein [Streptomyces bluensis]|uniref:Uncharacterized protein n=1 Tax=Streptomyces bluensis TaxID=33897 RepID=A0ABW6UAX6_9ACTN
MAGLGAARPWRVDALEQWRHGARNIAVLEAVADHSNDEAGSSEGS